MKKVYIYLFIRCVIVIIISILTWAYIWDDYEIGWLIYLPAYWGGVITLSLLVIFVSNPIRKGEKIATWLACLLVVFLGNIIADPQEIGENRNIKLEEHLQQTYKLNKSDEALETKNYAIVFRHSPNERPAKIEIYDLSGNLKNQYTTLEVINSISTVIPTEDVEQGYFEYGYIQETRYSGVRERPGYATLLIERLMTTEEAKQRGIQNDRVSAASFKYILEVDTYWNIILDPKQYEVSGSGTFIGSFLKRGTPLKEMLK